MLARLTLMLMLILPAGGTALAQERQYPLSPPSRPPVPLTDVDQERQNAEAREKVKPAEDKTGKQSLISVPQGFRGPHISSGNASIDALAADAAGRFGLDPCLIISVMKAESGFNPRAVSPKGASGLMQLMPQTAVRFGVKNIFDPRENVVAGSRYLRWLMDRFGDVRLALAGYNAGEGAVDFYQRRIPPFLETQNYVRLIYGRYSRTHAGLELPPEIGGVEAPEVASKVDDLKRPDSEKIPTYNQIIRLTSDVGAGPPPRQSS